MAVFKSSIIIDAKSNLTKVSKDISKSLKSATASAKKASKAFKSLSTNATKAGKSMRSMGAKGALGVTAPITAAVTASVLAFGKQADAIAQVEAGLKSTGGTVGLTSKKLQELASELQNTSVVGDEEILKGVTSQLLTFTNVAGKEFIRTQQAVLDVSTRVGTDLTSTAIQLGKALNDPIANLGALGRTGIQFSEDQKEVIKSLAESGRLAEAQKIILGELEAQYGGSAAAAAEAGIGPFKQLANIIGDVSEQFGELIVNEIKPFIKKMKELALSFKSLSPEMKRTILAGAALAAILPPIVFALGLMATGIGALIPAVTALGGAFMFLFASPPGLVILAIVAAVTALAVVIKRNWKPIKAALIDTWARMKVIAGPTLKRVKIQIGEIVKIIKDVFGPTMKLVKGWFKDAFGADTGGVIKTISKLMLQFTRDSVSGLESTVEAVKTLVGWYQKLVDVLSSLSFDAFESVNRGIDSVKGLFGAGEEEDPRDARVKAALQRYNEGLSSQSRTPAAASPVNVNSKSKLDINMTVDSEGRPSIKKVDSDENTDFKASLGRMSPIGA